MKTKITTVGDLKEHFGVRTMQIVREANGLRKAHARTVVEKRIDPVSFGKALRHLREDCGISLRDMANFIGVSAPFISDCELGKRNLSTFHTVLFVGRCQK